MSRNQKCWVANKIWRKKKVTGKDREEQSQRWPTWRHRICVSIVELHTCTLTSLTVIPTFVNQSKTQSVQLTISITIWYKCFPCLSYPVAGLTTQDEFFRHKLFVTPEKANKHSKSYNRCCQARETDFPMWIRVALKTQDMSYLLFVYKGTWPFIK